MASSARIALAGALLLGASCASEEELPQGPQVLELENIPTVEIARPGFRLSYPETWRLAKEAPGFDPDAFFLIEGPDGATIAVMILPEPADPASLVAAIIADHGLDDAHEREFVRWGRYQGIGIDVFGLNELGVPAGMRAFAHSTETQSFLVAETYVEYAYATARQGFDAVELSFTLDHSAEGWPDVSLGSVFEEDGRRERYLVRPGFELHFPEDWKIDADAPGYDPDSFFTLLTPYESSWMVVQILDGEFGAGALLSEARLGLESVLTEITSEDSFKRWGSLSGRGLVLRGTDRGLDATLRVFAHQRAGEALLVTEFWYDELEPRLAPGFGRVAQTFAFR